MPASAQDVVAQVKAMLTGTVVTTGYEFEPPTLRLAHQFSDSLADGNGADEANQVYQDKATVAASTEASYDLAASLVDDFGGTITFTIIKAIMVINTSTTASVLHVGGGTGADGTNAFDTWIQSAAGAGVGDGSERILLRPGGLFLLWAPDATGYAVTGGTADKLIIKERSALAGGAFELTIIGVV